MAGITPHSLCLLWVIGPRSVLSAHHFVSKLWQDSQPISSQRAWLGIRTNSNQSSRARSLCGSANSSSVCRESCHQTCARSYVLKGVWQVTFVLQYGENLTIRVYFVIFWLHFSLSPLQVVLICKRILNFNFICISKDSQIYGKFNNIAALKYHRKFKEIWFPH